MLSTNHSQAAAFNTNRTLPAHKSDDVAPPEVCRYLNVILLPLYHLQFKMINARSLQDSGPVTGACATGSPGIEEAHL